MAPIIQPVAGYDPWNSGSPLSDPFGFGGGLGNSFFGGYVSPDRANPYSNDIEPTNAGQVLDRFLKGQVLDYNVDTRHSNQLGVIGVHMGMVSGLNFTNPVSGTDPSGVLAVPSASDSAAVAVTPADGSNVPALTGVTLAGVDWVMWIGVAVLAWIIWEWLK